MAEVIGVRFKQVGKVYYFDPAGVQVQKVESGSPAELFDHPQQDRTKEFLQKVLTHTE